MKLDAIVPGDEALLDMERYVDEGAKTYSPFAARTEVAPQYRPRSDSRFSIWSPSLLKDCVSVFQADPAKSLLDFYVRPSRTNYV